MKKFKQYIKENYPWVRIKHRDRTYSIVFSESEFYEMLGEFLRIFSQDMRSTNIGDKLHEIHDIVAKSTLSPYEYIEISKRLIEIKQKYANSYFKAQRRQRGDSIC